MRTSCPIHSCGSPRGVRGNDRRPATESECLAVSIYDCLFGEVINPLNLPEYILSSSDPLIPPSLPLPPPLQTAIMDTLVFVCFCAFFHSPPQSSATSATLSSPSPISPSVYPLYQGCKLPSSGHGESVALLSASEYSRLNTPFILAPAPSSLDSSKDHMAFSLIGLPQIHSSISGGRRCTPSWPPRSSVFLH